MKHSKSNPIKASSTKSPDYTFHFQDEFLKTGLIALDAILGGQGIPRGVFIELRGPQGVGKTSIALQLCANLCKKGRRVLYIDAECAVSSSQINELGVFPYLNNGFTLKKASRYGDVEDTLDYFLKEEVVDFVVIDSVAALTKFGMPKSKSVCENIIGQDSGVMSKFLEKYNVAKCLNKVSFLFLNQCRTKVQMKGPTMEISCGGRAFEFYMDARIRLYSLEQMRSKKDNYFNDRSRDVAFGAKLIMEIFKSKFSTCFISIPIYLEYGRGVSNVLTLIDILKRKQVSFANTMRSIIKLNPFSVICEHEAVEFRNTEELKSFVTENYEYFISCLSAAVLSCSDNDLPCSDNDSDTTAEED